MVSALVVTEKEGVNSSIFDMSLVGTRHPTITGGVEGVGGRPHKSRMTQAPSISTQTSSWAKRG